MAVGRWLVVRLVALVVAIAGAGLLLPAAAGAQSAELVEDTVRADGPPSRPDRPTRPEKPSRPDKPSRPGKPATPAAPDNVLTCGTDITELGVYDVTSDLVCEAELATIGNADWQVDGATIEIRLNGFTVTGPADATAFDVSVLDGPTLVIDGGGGTISGFQKVTATSWPPYDASISNLSATSTVEGHDLTLSSVHIDMLGADACGVNSVDVLVMSDSSVTGASRAGVCASDATLERVTLSGNSIGARVLDGEFAGQFQMVDSMVTDNDSFGALVSVQDSHVQGSSFIDNGASGFALEVGTWADLNCGSCPGDFNPTKVVIVDSVFSGNGYAPAEFGPFSNTVGNDGITLVNPWEPGLIGLVGTERQPATLTVELSNVSLTNNADAGVDVTGNDLVTSSTGVAASGNQGVYQCVGISC